MKKKVLVSLFFTTLFLIGAVTFLPPIGIKYAIQNWAKSNINGEVHVKNITFNPLKLHIEASDILVTEHDTKKVLSIDEIFVDLSTKEILSKKIIADSFKLTNISLYLKKNTDRLSIYTLMKDNAKKDTYEERKNNDWSMSILNISLDNLSVLLQGKNIPEHDFFAKIEHTEIDHLLMQFNDKSLSIEEIRINKLTHNIDRLSNSEIIYSHIVQEKDREKSKEIIDEILYKNKGLNTEIKKISIKKSNVNFYDHSLTPIFKKSLTNINASIHAFTYPEKKPFKFSLQFSLAQNEGEFHQEGDISLLNSTINISHEHKNIKISGGNSYLNYYTWVNVDEGEYSTTGNNRIVFSPYFNIKGDNYLSLKNLSITNNKTDKTLIKNKSTEVTKLRFESFKNIHIDSITVDQPNINIYRDENKNINWASLLKKDSNEKRRKKTPPGEENKKEKQSDGSFFVSLKRLSIKNGVLTGEDKSLNDAEIQLSNTNIDLKNLSTHHDEKITGTLSTIIDDHADLLVNGEWLIKDTINSESSASLKNYDLTASAPITYSYLGYKIQHGKLSFDLDHQIVNSQLTSSNKLHLQQFKLGDKIKNEKPITALLPLASSILSDNNGNITLDLPVNGDLSDPSLTIRHIMLTSINNTLTKIVTSPFSILQNLVNSKRKIGQLAFNPGEEALTNETKESLLALTKVLKKRDKLTLLIPPLIDDKTDKAALQKNSLSQELLLKEVNINNKTKYRYFLLSKLTKKDKINYESKPITEIENKVITDIDISEKNLKSLSDARQNITRVFILANGITADRVLLSSKKTEITTKDGSLLFSLDLKPRG